MADSTYLAAIARDDTLPIERQAVRHWLNDLKNPLRWVVGPLIKGLCGLALYAVWWAKRLPLPQFRAHGLLQWLICWFCRHFVSRDANMLILRHFATESNLLNFLADNSGSDDVQPVALYPRCIDDMRQDSFVEHDQQLFRLLTELGQWNGPRVAVAASQLNWTHWREIRSEDFDLPARRSQVLDFETAHALFMCLFCLLLTRQEYQDAINGFNLDQSIALRIGELIGEPWLAEMAYNKQPLYLLGPGNLGQRFLMHGFFTEQLYARLERLRTSP